ncbi:phage antirepressor N-terminal domain-containing protein [Actinomycetaceae bacterium TAE3-ERU4]|nr:phage antirepressor N-terminal domain-containing protein [Actinomycetaceae bacterium TAE3-ERU4]
MTELIPSYSTQLVAEKINGVPFVAAKPIYEAIGISWPSQYKNLRSRPWAVIAESTITGTDGNATK